ncbi:MAG: endo-1,4-beta-xylanase [Acetatifactor sp.]
METLKEKYAPYFKIGTAFEGRDLDRKADLIRTHFNSMTCANAMKYVSLTHEPGSYHFDRADRLVSYAKENQMAIHGHTLVWHNQTPDYIFENTTPEQLLETLRDHTQKVKDHFGELASFDAVNEAIEDKSDAYLRDTKWYRILGEDYIAKVFRTIHEVMPNTRLFYNDYNECYPEKRTKIMRLLKGLLAEGVPVSGMGLQSHISIYGPDFDEIKRSIEDYASLGLRLRISELDVSMYKDNNPDDPQVSMPNPELMKKQADYYRELFKIYRSYAQHIDAVTFWGVADSDSWLNYFPVPGRRNYPLLFDDNGEPKEAFYSIMDF